MPHVRLEYSANLASQFNSGKTLMRINQALVDTGHFKAEDIKSRLIACDDFLVGTSTEGHAFMHAQIIILSGREAEVKAQISQQVLDALLQCVKPLPGVINQIGVQMLDNERATYAKRLI